ncbi:MAG: hypothetical protein JO069_08800 [Verrucomicrobia bacterium]|nr:hypothetical protein [Verrucomicrobiota bacterium]
MKIENAKFDDIVKFLSDSFDPVDGSGIVVNDKSQHMKQYASLAILLSDSVNFRNAAMTLSEILKTGYDSPKLKDVRGKFSLVLSRVAEDLGFCPLVVTFNGQLEHDTFAKYVRSGCLFRDVFTRPHGEFTHAIQWLTMACVHGKKVAELYAYSVGYRSKQKFETEFGNERIYLWNFLVDCFPEKKTKEDYQNNIFAENFRCPQYTTKHLNNKLPTDSWLGEFIYARSCKGLKGGQQVPEESHYFQKPGKRNVVMSSKQSGRTYNDNGVEKPVYGRLEVDAKGHPVVLAKLVQEKRVVVNAPAPHAHMILNIANNQANNNNAVNNPKGEVDEMDFE